MTTRAGDGSAAGPTPDAQSEEFNRSSASSGTLEQGFDEAQADQFAERFRPSWESPAPKAAEAAHDRTEEHDLPIEPTRRSRPPRGREKEKEEAVVPDAIGVIGSSKHAFLYVAAGASVVVAIAAIWVWDLGKGTPPTPENTASAPLPPPVLDTNRNEPAKATEPPAPVATTTEIPAAASPASPTPTPVGVATQEPSGSAVAVVSPPPVVIPAPPVAAPAPPVAAAPPPPPPPAPTLVSIRVRTEPTNAMLTLDGRPVSNPFDQRIEKNSARHRLEARLDGYRIASQNLVFDGDRDATLRLDPIPVARPVPARSAPARPAPPARRAEPSSRPRRSNGGFVSDNPFD